MTRAQAVRILKAAESTKLNIVQRRQRVFFKPFFRAKKPWAASAARCAAAFALDVDGLLKQYRDACIGVIQAAGTLGGTGIRKEKQYKTHEYLDERYNRVVVPDVRDALTELTDGFEVSLAESYDKYISNGLVSDAGALVYEDMGANFEFNRFDELTRDHLRDKTINWSKQVAGETERTIKRELVRDNEAGLGSYEAAENIRRAAEFSFARSEMIARTEVMLSCNYAEYTSMMENPDVVGAEWCAAGDERTRPTHSKANGQKRRKGEPFDVGGYKMLYPGDSSFGAPAGEIISCRCTLLAVFEGEGLDSSTVYDESDAGTEDWLKRQDTDFQEEYWGGKTKLALGNAGLLRLDERDKPLREILEGLYPVKTAVADIQKVSALPEAAVMGVIKRANEVWLHGALNGTEANVTLSADSGIKAFKNIVGQPGRITDESEDAVAWLEYLGKAKPMSVVTVHNHNNMSSFSITDLELFIGRDSIKSMFVVDAAGNLFLLEKVPGVAYNADKIISDITYELRKRYVGLQHLGDWNSLDDKEKSLKRHQMYDYAIWQFFKKAGVRIGKF